MANEIKITQGDVFRLAFRLKDSPSTFHNLAGATCALVITALDGTSTVFDNNHFTLSDQTVSPGGGTVLLSTAETPTLGEGALKEILIRVTQGSDVLTWRKKRVLQVLPPDPIDGA